MTTESSADTPPDTGSDAPSDSPPEPAVQLGADELRYLLVAELADARRPMTIAELVASIERRGAVITLPDSPSPPHKVVSDSLRWEKSKGRVRSVSRGVYTTGSMPRSTKSWIRGKARRIYGRRRESNSLQG